MEFAMRNLIVAIAAGLVTLPLIAPAQAPAPSEGRPPPGPSLKIDNDIEYTKAGGQSLKLDLYRVQPSNAPLPVVVWIHGAESPLNTRAASPAVGLARANTYAIASIDYRANASRADQLSDVKSAIRFLRTNAAAYNLNPDRLAVFGYDVGGQLAALVGTTADVANLNPSNDAPVQAVIDIAGPVTGGGLDPSNFVTANDAPALLFHGSADNTVSTQESQKLISKLKAAGVNSQLEMPFAVGHRLGDLLSPVAMQTVSLFLDNNLRDIKSQAALSAFISTPAHVFVDPVALDLGGTRYGLYPAPVLGANAVASYRVYLPPDYDSNPTKRYPVIYFLHGASVDSKRPITSFYISRADAAIRSGVMAPAIIVLAQGDNQGGYMDSQDGKYPAESVLVKNLIPYIDANYRTIATREMRAIEGHSMGGAGALRVGLKFPELFATVTGNSPALVRAPEPNEPPATPSSRGDANYVEAQSPVAIVKANVARAKTQKIRIIIGDKDPLYPGAANFHQLLTSLGVPHEWQVVTNSPHNHDQLLQYETFDTMAFYANVFPKRSSPGSH